MYNTLKIYTASDNFGAFRVKKGILMQKGHGKKEKRKKDDNEF